MTKRFAETMKTISLSMLLMCVTATVTQAQWNETEKHPRYEINVTIAGENIGSIDIELDAITAPRHVRNFDSLVKVKFYDGTLFHRIIPGFVIQGGDPNTKTKPREKWGQGDSTQTNVPAEFSAVKHVRGTISAARKGNDINSATSQFFVCVDDTPNLDSKYTAYGTVVRGMEVVDKIVELSRDEKDRPIERVEMNIKRTR